MTDNLSTRVAALELLVEQLILERVQMAHDPSAAVRIAMGQLTQIATDRPGVPKAAIGAVADVLAAVMLRLEQDDHHGDLPPMRWGHE